MIAVNEGTVEFFASVITLKIYKNSTEETRGHAFKQSLYLKPMVGRFELTKMHVWVREKHYTSCRSRS